MSFLAPIAFWFAFTIPVVVVFYLLKRRRVVRVVPSTLLWQRFLAETQASAPFQKLRHNWLLILQLLLLLLAILALARPYLSARTIGGRTLVVILDTSASMQATDESPSRFEKARIDALRLVDSMHDNDTMYVLQAGASTEVKQSATREKSALRRALQSAAVTDTGTHLKEALKLAETLVQNNSRAEIHLFSDGAVGALDGFDNSGLPLEFHRIGQRANNLAITSLDVRANPENPSQRAVFANVVNFSTNAHQTEIEFLLDERIIETKPLTLAPGETSPQVFLTAQERSSGVFTVRLTGKDDLAVDDQASVVSLLPQHSKVLLVTAGNRFLEKALRAAQNVELTVAPTVTEPSNQFDVVVLDSTVPMTWPAGNVLVINVANPAWFEKPGKLDAPPIVDWKGSHALLRFVSFDNVQIGQSLAVKTPQWAVSLVDSPQTPLILAGELGRQRIVWVGFDTLQSTWPLRISFPIFVANAMEWLSPTAINGAQLAVQAGNPFRLSLAQQINSVELTRPDNTTRLLPVDIARGEFVFGETTRQGVYRLKAGTNDVVFCVNLLDSSESNIEPKNELRFGQYSKAATVSLRQANMELWRWIALAGLIVLMFEWWWYHRRTV
ncbi:MAG: VWA domain-containing protein [Pedosphaera sp.]|nr:VWA domain-containing protein [Pedosphaera sp.]